MYAETELKESFLQLSLRCLLDMHLEIFNITILLLLYCFISDEAIFEFKSGLVEFSYPSHMKKDKERWQREYVKETEDTLAFSFSTEMPDCAILFVYSGSSSEYIKISLVSL